MKKITMTLVILFGLTIGTFAQEGGLFGKGATRDEIGYGTRDGAIGLPSTHGSTSDQGAPLGSGIFVLAGLGAAYLASKKNNKE